MVKGKLLGPEDVYVESWKTYKNVEIEIKKDFASLDINPPKCPYHGVNVVDVKQVLDLHPIASKVYHVNRYGQLNLQLIELYEKLKKGKMSASETFAKEREMRAEYKPSGIEPPISSTTDNIAVKCSRCSYPLGLITVNARAKPDYPIRPDIDFWINAPKTEKETRFIKEEFKLGDLPLKDWIAGTDQKPLIDTLETFAGDLSQASHVMIWEVTKSIQDLKTAVHTAIEKVKDEVSARKNRLYNFLATYQATMAAIAKAEKEEIEKREALEREEQERKKREGEERLKRASTM